MFMLLQCDMCRAEDRLYIFCFVRSQEVIITLFHLAYQFLFIAIFFFIFLIFKNSSAYLIKLSPPLTKNE